MEAKKHSIYFNIGPDGEITIEVEGLSGEACLETTREMEEALGVVTDRQATAGMYEEVEQAEEETQTVYTLDTGE